MTAKFKYSSIHTQIIWTSVIISTLVGLGIIILSYLIDWEYNWLMWPTGFGIIFGSLNPILISYYYKSRPYLIIDDGNLIRNSLFPKKIDLNRIERVEYLAENYRILTPEKELIIYSQWIAPESMDILLHILKEHTAEDEFRVRIPEMKAEMS